MARKPAIGGPTTAGTTQAALIQPKTRGRASSGYTAATTTYSATTSAPAPSPETARPTSRAGNDVAVPQTTRPPANRVIPAVNGQVGPRLSARPPATTMPSRLAVRNSENARE